MSLAENPRARLGGNFPPPDEERAPPKSERIIDTDRARQIEVAAGQVGRLFHIGQGRIWEKRKGGEEGRSLRNFLIAYARGLGSPVWECAMIFDLNRKQIGQEEAAYLNMLASDDGAGRDADNMTAMCDSAARVNCKRYMKVSLASAQAELASQRAIKVAKEAADLLEASAPPPPPPKPKRPQSMLDWQCAEVARKRDLAAIDKDIRICLSVVAKAIEHPTKETKKDAAEAAKALEILGRKLKKLKRATPKPPSP